MMKMISTTRTTITKRLLIIVTIFIMISGAVSAQDTVPIGPIGSVEAGDFRALAVTADGSRLLIADAENDQLRVYTFDDPANPTLISSVDLEGEPLSLAAAQDFALVGVDTGEARDAVRVIAPSLYMRPRGYAEVNSIDTVPNPQRIALALNNDWAIVVGDGGYTLLELVSAGEIDSLPVQAGLVDAAIAGDTAFLLGEGALETQALGANLNRQRAGRVELDGAARHITINAGASLGVITLADNRLLFFSPSTLEIVNTFTVNGAAILDAQFISAEDAEWLALVQDGSSEITLLDVSDPANVGDLGSLSTQFETPVQAMITYNELIIATDGQTVRIFTR